VASVIGSLRQLENLETPQSHSRVRANAEDHTMPMSDLIHSYAANAVLAMLCCRVVWTRRKMTPFGLQRMGKGQDPKASERSSSMSHPADGQDWGNYPKRTKIKFLRILSDTIKIC
jgi:ABC-type uncharacterized transport system permease subunit